MKNDGNTFVDSYTTQRNVAMKSDQITHEICWIHFDRIFTSLHPISKFEFPRISRTNFKICSDSIFKVISNQVTLSSENMQPTSSTNSANMREIILDHPQVAAKVLIDLLQCPNSKRVVEAELAKHPEVISYFYWCIIESHVTDSSRLCLSNYAFWFDLRMAMLWKQFASCFQSNKPGKLSSNLLARFNRPSAAPTPVRRPSRVTATASPYNRGSSFLGTSIPSQELETN